MTRPRRGLQIIREVKNNPYKVIKTFIIDNKVMIGIKNDTISTIKITELPIADRYSTGTQISKHNLVTAFQEERLEEEVQDEVIEEEPRKRDQISLEEIDDRLMTIDDFLK
jgi:hypothetical protein